MHIWGDEWPFWGDLWDAVTYLHDQFDRRGFKILSIKEKFGTIRTWFAETPAASEYRRAYMATVARFPHIAAEILVDADYGDQLVGVVNPETCNHPFTWKKFSDPPVVTCGVCWTDVTNPG